MGFRKNLKKLLTGGAGADAGPPEPVTRWEKAVAALSGISKQVSKIDPDGIDVYCFPGADGGGVDRYKNVVDRDSVMALVSAQEPAGPCRMAEALSLAFASAAERSGDKPVSMLVVTAGQPDDEEEVIKVIKKAVEEQHSYLSITFVHIGDDPDAEEFLRRLDENMTGMSADGAEVDIVDTVKDEDMRSAMDEMKKPDCKAGIAFGALLGAFAGAAAGAGGAYLLAKQNAAKRTEGWNGKWEVLSQPGDTPTGVVLDVADDMAGNLTIEGYPEDYSFGPKSATARYLESEEGYEISREAADGSGDEGARLSGTVVDEHFIEWADNTSWREVDPGGVNWGMVAGGGVAGAFAGGAGGGALGALTQKKFFNKAANKTPADYVIIVDRSAKMDVADTGKGHKK